MRKLPKIIKPSKEDKKALRAWNRKLLGKKIKKRKQRIRKLPRSYATYILSKIWKERKNRYWRTHRKVCVGCNSTKFIHLHHAVYSGYDGTERDENLFALCKVCHTELHERFGTKRDMINETILFIEEKRQ